MKRPYMDWRDNLVRWMKKRRINQVELAGLTGFSVSRINNYCIKRRGTEVNENTIITIAKGLNIHPAELRYGINLSINILFFEKCRKVILKSANINNLTLSETQKRIATANLYNHHISSKILPLPEVIEVIDNIEQ